jgi:hypothetical protein
MIGLLAVLLRKMSNFFLSLVGTFEKLVMKSYFLTHPEKIGKF